MADAGSSGVSDDEHDGPEPVEHSPNGRYGRMDIVLGRGAFKSVYQAFDEEEGTEVAWNQVRVVELVNSKEERDRLFAEIRVLKQLKHKNIMSFHESWLDQSTMCVNFITELFTSGTLRQYRKRHRHIDEDVLNRWAWQILCGLVSLHGHTPPIIHRDLKCDNIFINGSQGVFKIGDLGLATLLRACTAPQSVLGTPESMAPELYEEEYDDRVDVYSYGMCLLELATMEYPYVECRNAAQIYRKVTLGVRPAGLGRVSSRELADFIAVCIRPKDERPRSRQLLKHPYFDSIRERAIARAKPLSATASQVDIFSDYASVRSSSGNGSDVSRSSSVAEETDAGVVSALLPRLGNDGESTASAALLSNAVGKQSPRAHSAAALIPVRSGSGEHHLTGSLQSAVESLHTIAESLPGLLESGPSLPAQLYIMVWVDFAEQPQSQAITHRDFRVRGKLQPDMGKLNLRLRISEPEVPAKTVEFDFDLGADTAMSVASEMVEDLSLSAEDARAIAAAIKDEIKLLTGLLDRRTNDSLASSSERDVQAGPSSPPDSVCQPGGEYKEEQHHPFDADDADLQPFLAATEQPAPFRRRTQPSEHLVEPGGHSGSRADLRKSLTGSRADRVSFDESCSQPGGCQHLGVGSSHPAATMASSALRSRPSPRSLGSPLPGYSPRMASPLLLARPAHSMDEAMGISIAAGSQAPPDSDAGSVMSIVALDSSAQEANLSQLSAIGNGSSYHSSEFGMPPSGTLNVPKELDCGQLGMQLGLVGIKRSGSGALSPPPRPPERKVPLMRLCQDAGHIMGVAPCSNGVGHAGSLPMGFSGDAMMKTLPQRGSGNSFESTSVRLGPPCIGGGMGVVHQARCGLPLGQSSGCHSSVAAASTQTQHGGVQPDLDGISGGERPHQSTASLPAAVASSLGSLAQRFSSQ